MKKTASKKQNNTFCICCQAQIKAVKVSTHVVKLAEKESKRKSVGTCAPKKKPKSTKASVTIIHKLRCLATFQAQLYIFTKVEKTKGYVRFALTEDHFRGNPHKRIQGSCKQLIEGVGAFCSLYNIIAGEHNVELVLEPPCCGKETLSSYVAGVNFTAEDINTFGNNNKIKGCALWTKGVNCPSID